MVKKLMALLMAALMLFGAAACNNDNGTTEPQNTQKQNEQETNQQETNQNADGSFTLYYPEFMHELEGETLVLDKAPERIVCLSNTALQVLARFDVHPVAVTSLSKSGDFPDWVRELPQIEVGMSGLDIEAIVAMEPDLVMVGEYQKEEYGKQFDDAGIKVYYTTEGPSVTYGETRDGTIAIARSFGTQAQVKEIEDAFAAAEARCAEYTAAHGSKTMMIFFSQPGSYQQTSQGYLGSMLAMLPFENLSDKLIDPTLRTAPTDVETCIKQNPEIIFAISPGVPTGEQVREMFEETFNSDRELWNQLDAVANDNIIYLGTEYISSKGLQIVDSLNKLVDLLESRGDGQIVLNYPSNMQARGYTEPLVLEKKPEKVVSMSTSPVLALNNLGVNMIAVPASAVVQWPENMKDVTTLQLAHNTNFDIETVVAMEPDLVILGYTSEDTYGKVLTDVNIPVYYVDAGHTVPYASIKLQTEALIDAFGKGSAAGDAMMKAFADLEARLAESKKQLEGKTVMVLQSSPPSHYIQTSGGTLGSMAEMIGLTNVYKNDQTFMAPVDYETALELDPDVVLCVGMSPTGEGHKTLMEEDFANNPEYWNSIPAIERGDVIYLPVRFVSSAGINVIDNIGELTDIITAHFAE
ncbi:MAG: ABC transporter substrate-binding protein [Clostridia bacterium]|nr:ABC transporter substrate-binding protein [Clostridia bacterium]